MRATGELDQLAFIGRQHIDQRQQFRRQGACWRGVQQGDGLGLARQLKGVQRGFCGHFAGGHDHAAVGQQGARCLHLCGTQAGARTGVRRNAVVAIVKHQNLGDAAALSGGLLDMAGGDIVS